jgi:hypothetical protein
MDNRLATIIFGLAFCILCHCVILAPSALAQEFPKFSFDVTYEVDGPFGKGSLRQASDGKGHFLHETTAANGKRDICLLDLANKKMTVLVPKEGVAIPTTMTERRSSLIYDEERAKQKGAKPIGAKNIDGHPCHGWEINSAGNTENIWIGDDTKYLVRSESSNKVCKVVMTLKKWSNKSPAASSFEVPNNYKITKLPDNSTKGTEMPEGMDVVLRYLKENKSEQAVEQLNKMIQKEPNQKSLLVMRGGVLFRNLRKNDEALSDFNKVIQLDPNWFQGYKRRGEFFTHVKRNDEALSDLNKCVALAPEYGEGHLSRAVLLAKTGKYKEALDDLDKAEKYQSQNAELILRLRSACHTLLQKK